MILGLSWDLNNKPRRDEVAFPGDVINGLLYFPCLEPNSRISILVFIKSVRILVPSSILFCVVLCAVRCTYNTYDRMIVRTIVGRKTSLCHRA